MENQVFNTEVTTMKKYFAPVSGLTGNQAKATTAVSETFIGIGKILNEGNVADEYAAIALTKLHEAKLAVDYAISQGWNGGTSH